MPTTGSPIHPDLDNTHTPAGANANLCDGHAQWIPKKQYTQGVNISQDSPATEPGKSSQ